MAKNRNEKPVYGNPGYQPPPVPDLKPGSPEAEVWLDIVNAAVAGYTAATWSNDGVKVNIQASSVAIRAATEVADGVLAEYLYRVGLSVKGEKTPKPPPPPSAEKGPKDDPIPF